MSLSHVICFEISIETVYFLNAEFLPVIFRPKATVFVVSFSSNKCKKKSCRVYFHQGNNKSLGVSNLFHRLYYVNGKFSEECADIQEHFFHLLETFLFPCYNGKLITARHYVFMNTVGKVSLIRLALSMIGSKSSQYFESNSFPNLETKVFEFALRIKSSKKNIQLKTVSPVDLEEMMIWQVWRWLEVNFISVLFLVIVFASIFVLDVSFKLLFFLPSLTEYWYRSVNAYK